ncbi:hypothetical protein B0I12_002572 [Microbacterium hydrothermale]|uniref:hypothetical protein n=1 Tax=Microbacterium hydrothermale TaxID=857427 RepID=UPI002226759A|nr:hypothetical protein [Microbacterium hydrothermale]MCW2165417.1 hypothetical protein [Microbacterium hydrothermale]
MAKYTYTLRVTDFSGSPFPGAVPRARIRPMRDASGPDGMLSSRDIPVTLDGSGRGAADLVATVDTAPETRYRLVVDWLTTTQSGQEIAGWGSEWEFTAVAGGGDIKTMGDVPASAIFYGPPWPANTPPGLYIDTATGDIGWKEPS